MNNLKINSLVLYSCFLYTLVILTLSKPVFADTISTGGGNKIHFINLKSKSGSDAILLESNGHFGLIDVGEDYDFPDGSNLLYPDRWGISRENEDTIEDRLFRHLKQVGVKKLDFVLGTHVHSDHIGTADEVLKRYPVDRFYLKKYSDERITTQWRLWDNLYNYDNAVRTALERGVTLIQDISDKDSHFKLGNMDIQLYNYKNEYGPDGKLKRVYDDNSNSIVAVVNVAGKKIYLGGDLDNDQGAEDRLGPVIGKVDMMKWNHHFDATISNTVNFIENLSPSIVVQTSGLDINRQSTTNLLREKNIQTIKAYSKTKDATVFDISDSGFSNVSDSFPDIPTVSEKWYKEDGYWKYRLSDNQMAIGWKKINGVYYFFNGQGQMQADRWLHLKDSKEKIDGNWYYLKKDGSMQESGWFKHDGAWYYITWSGARTYNELAEIGGQKYLFDKDGKMLTGLQVFNGKKMFFASNGSLQAQGRASSWQKIGVSWYYYDGEGVPSVGLKKINGKTYYFDNYGIMKTGWVFLDGHWNYFTSDGDMKTGWVKDKDIWYYLDKDGVMLTGLQEINGSRYYLNASGAMQTGWKWLDNHYYYFVSSGAMKTGWLKDKDVWYYLDKDGVMLTGFQEIDGSRYYLNASGAMQTGWKWLDNHYYYFTSSGAMKTGWLKDKDTWYYLDKEGIMLTGLQEIDDSRYYLNTSGAMQTGWKWFNNHYYYFTGSGAMKTGWFKDKGLWYYLDKEGIMLTGLQEINGARYYLNASGAMETGWKQLNGNWYYFQTNGSLLRNGTSPDGYKLNADGIWTTVTTEETTQERTVANSQGHIFETTEVERTQQTESSSVTSEEKNQSTEPKTQTSQENN
ncbi:MBL fold metallo-hydrolase [Streptococcus infantis]|uniref:MBL fold metallo-hydrolase n=1 Tax=Streptococcus infantis TaxID=68892 RepID=UPI001CBE7707|nr:MBL fold metallo-hydrolase [Streptococcus infantis]MBZ2119803.1 MBL fold metallo-hydrolase [Streptococcus infantis]MBZ2121622.1 MBL fold metallo-hydrolase [Streptococcus infantis]MBZ2125527.1 MBL fold metallo-hydrolase [Streptococcus infantis]